MAAIAEAIEEIRCRRCALAPSVGQLRFFEEGSEGGEVGAVYDGGAAVKDNESHWPHVATSSCGRDGFWRERTPMVFGNRSGVGPLLMMPDTNILIEIRKQLSEVEGGLIIHPQWDAHDDPIDALREVVQLWWFRDVRFAVSPQHLVDSRRKPLTGDRRRAREDAIRELEIDFFERGGVEAVVSEEWLVEDRPCALHAIPPPHLSTSSTATKDWGWPKDDLDRRLVKAAYDSRCHVFLTADKGILKCHASLFPKGLAVMSPAQLLEALDSSGGVGWNPRSALPGSRPVDAHPALRRFRELTLHVTYARSPKGDYTRRVTRWLRQQVAPAAQIGQSRTSFADLARGVSSCRWPSAANSST